MSETDSIRELSDRVRDFADRRDWAQFHDPKNLAMALAAEVGELNAILRWVRSDAVDRAVREPGVRERIEAEIGDVAILLLQLCTRTGIELGQAVTKKLSRNESAYPEGQSRGLSERPGN